MRTGGDLFGEVFQRSDNAMAIVGRDLVLRGMNASCRRLLGQSGDDLGTLEAHIPETSRLFFRDAARKAFDGRMIDSEALPVLRADGTTLLVRIETARVADAVEDLLLFELEPEEGIGRVEDSLELLKYAVESANDAIIITTPELEAPHPLIEYVNPAFSRMTGWQAHEVVGKSPRLLQGPRTAREMLDRLRRGLENDSQFFGENWNYRKDGSPYYVEWRITPLRGRDGRTTHWVAIQRDITDRQKREEEAEAFNRTLERRVAERTRELEDVNRELQSFSYTVSHDLRSPLRSLLGFSRALEEDYGDKLDEQARDYIKRMTGAARRMDELITTILGLSRLSRARVDLSDCDVSGIARVVASDLGVAFPKVRFEIAPDIHARADSGLLRVVLHNLFENGAKFTAEAAEPAVTLGETMREDRRFITVSDNGMGFDASKASAIFEPFERLYAGVGIQGTGIGLATVDRIVKRHQGRVFAESAPGEGATFLFTLDPL